MYLMKKYKFNIFTVMLLLSGFLMTGCDDNMPVVKEVAVASISLKEELIGGLTIKTGETAFFPDFLFLRRLLTSIDFFFMISPTDTVSDSRITQS